MDRRQFEQTLTEVYGIPSEHPFARYPSVAVFRHTDNHRWFAAIMTIPACKLTAGAEGSVDTVNLKCAPEMLDTLWGMDGIYPAYHMSKSHWITACLDGRVSDDALSFLVGASFNLTAPKPRQKRESAVKNS